MNFRAALRRMGGPELSEDDSMDPTMMGADAPSDNSGWQPGIGTDGQDPASPGGPAPYNGAPPGHGEPVASDPMWSDPDEPNVQGSDMPHLKAPNLESQTLHNARRVAYETMGRTRNA